jgi:hypothetical protein
MKIKRQSPLTKMARRGFRGYPVVTVAFYGPNADTASKVAVALLTREEGEPEVLERWFAEEEDVRKDYAIGLKILEFIERHQAKSVAVTDGIIGCPHEEGIDYPDGEVCPKCPYWAHRDRWTKDLIQ